MSRQARIFGLSAVGLALLGLGALVLLGPEQSSEVDFQPLGNGTIVYDAGGNIRMVNPDGSEDGRVLGRVGDDLYQHCPAYSPDGRSLSHLQGYPQHDLVFTPLDTRGRPAGRAGQIRVFEGPTLRCGKWSPDGRFVALVGVSDRSSHLILVDAAELSTDVAMEAPTMPDAVWSPDSQLLAYPAKEGIVLIDVTDGDTELLTTRAPPLEVAWSPDGTVLAFTGIPEGKTLPDLLSVDRDGRNEVTLIDSDLHESRLAWSPDGSRVAVVQERCGRTRPCFWQITAIDRSFDALIVVGPTVPGLGSGEQGAFGRPMWSPDGNSIIFSLLAWEEGAPGAEVPLVIAPAGGGPPRVVTEEIGIDVYDWRGVPG